MSRWLLALLFAFGSVTMIGCGGEEEAADPPADTDEATDAVDDAVEDATDAVDDAADAVTE